MKKNWKLKDIIDGLKKAYSGKIGVEYMHINNDEQQAWVRDQMESSVYDIISNEEKIHNYERLCWAVLFGDFMTSKF